MPDSPQELGVASPSIPLLRAVRPALMLIGVISLLRVFYLIFLCPYTLIEDEAQYWVWSKMLDWSYYTKGPGVAWAIFASTSVFGDGEWAVRLPSVIASAVGAFSLSALAWDISRSRRVAFLTAAAFHCVPTFLALALLMTIDGSLVACWALAAWASWRCWGDDDARSGGKASLTWLLVLATAIGVGTLFKYTMLLFVPGVLVWLLVWRRSLARTAPLAWMLFVGVLSLTLAPVAYWNHREGWPTIAHLLGHLGLKGGDVAVTQGAAGGGWHYDPMWTLTFIGTQIALIGPVLFLGLRHAWSCFQSRGLPVEADEHSLHATASMRTWQGQSLLIALSAPVLIFYLFVSFIAEPEGNWPVAGAVTLVPLAAMRAAMAWSQSDRSRLRWARFLWSAAVVLGLVVGLGMLRVDLARHLPVVGKLVPVGRFTGATLMGQDAAKLMSQLRAETGQEPFIIANHYGRASQLWYYLPPRDDGSRVPVYCSSSVMPGGRKTPWDFWPSMDFRRATGLDGRPAVAVGLSTWHWQQVFANVRKHGALEGDHKRNKQGEPSRPAFLCAGFKGFPRDGSRVPFPPYGQDENASDQPPATTGGGGQ